MTEETITYFLIRSLKIESNNVQIDSFHDTIFLLDKFILASYLIGEFSRLQGSITQQLCAQTNSLVSDENIIFSKYPTNLLTILESSNSVTAKFL